MFYKVQSPFPPRILQGTICTIVTIYVIPKSSSVNSSTLSYSLANWSNTGIMSPVIASSSMPVLVIIERYKNNEQGSTFCMRSPAEGEGGKMRKIKSTKTFLPFLGKNRKMCGRK